MARIKIKFNLNSILDFKAVVTLLEFLIRFIAINIVVQHSFLAGSNFTSTLTLWVEAGIYIKNLVTTLVYINLVGDAVGVQRVPGGQIKSLSLSNNSFFAEMEDLPRRMESSCSHLGLHLLGNADMFILCSPDGIVCHCSFLLRSAFPAFVWCQKTSKYLLFAHLHETAGYSPQLCGHFLCLCRLGMQHRRCRVNSSLFSGYGFYHPVGRPGEEIWP